MRQSFYPDERNDARTEGTSTTSQSRIQFRKTEIQSRRQAEYSVCCVPTRRISEVIFEKRLHRSAERGIVGVLAL